MEFERAASGLYLPEGMLGRGVWKGQLFRKGKLIDEFEDHNLIVNQGLNSNLGVYFQGQTPITSWFMGIFQGNYTPVSTDTAATIASASTECSSYASPTRPAWTPAAPSAQSITNSASPASFVFNASQTIYGAFLVSSNVIGGTAGTLWSAGVFSSSKDVVSGDQLLMTYTFNSSSA